MVKKFLAGLIILITLFQLFSPCSYAIEMDGANIVFTGRTVEGHLLYNKKDVGVSSVKCSIVGYYNNDNKFYPAYCVNYKNSGAEGGSYNVDISNYTDNEKVWRIVTHGFPYTNTFGTNGEITLSDDDAYLVTKIAIYCVTGNSYFGLYTKDINQPITVNTYNALDYLVNTVAEDTSIQRQMGTITIEKSGEFTENRKLLFSRFFSKFNIRARKL